MNETIFDPDPDPDSNPGQAIDQRLAARLAALRQQAGWSLDMLAERSGISRATLSRIERGETSPTAALLGRLCTAYGRTMSRLLAEVEADPPALLRRAEQTVWIDPETGFKRRSVSPPARGYMAEVLEGELPPHATIAYDAPSVAGLEQHVVLLGGRLDLTVDGHTHRLRAGDSLRFRLFGPTRFVCPGPDAAHYLIAIVQP
ncbi:helix-turn-helix domain-containing protein [Rhodopila sp.]|jgi:transcriptional regulator with XRE-family HTH domain|uniref:helix-turn-helix domain-containing protein n=1 Tax=Rhodopila sp. TaxID=2480087 RepID=UPI002BB42058|nr:helix-turn-helix domain-containing protein [Rhodopila sp.]HVZ07046.1 helix-turn-helix domain-containing protein [Rhodopila sp.]